MKIKYCGKYLYPHTPIFFFFTETPIMLLVLNVEAWFSGRRALSLLSEGDSGRAGWAADSGRRSPQPAVLTPGRSAVCGRSADSQHPTSHHPEAEGVPLRRHRAPAEPDLRCLHHHESRLRRQS